MKDDGTLVELASAGDQAAFAELYQRYFDRVYDFLARMVRDPPPRPLTSRRTRSCAP